MKVWVLTCFIADGGGSVKGVFLSEGRVRAVQKKWRENPEDALADYYVSEHELEAEE